MDCVSFSPSRVSCQKRARVWRASFPSTSKVTCTTFGVKPLPRPSNSTRPRHPWAFTFPSYTHRTSGSAYLPRWSGRYTIHVIASSIHVVCVASAYQHSTCTHEQQQQRRNACRMCAKNIKLRHSARHKPSVERHEPMQCITKSAYKYTSFARATVSRLW